MFKMLKSKLKLLIKSLASCKKLCGYSYSHFCDILVQFLSAQTVKVKWSRKTECEYAGVKRTC